MRVLILFVACISVKTFRSNLWKKCLLLDRKPGGSAESLGEFKYSVNSLKIWTLFRQIFALLSQKGGSYKF